MHCDYPDCLYCSLPDITCTYCYGNVDNMPCNCGLADDACFCSYLDRVCSICNNTGYMRPFGMEWIPLLNDFISMTKNEKIIETILAYVPLEQKENKRKEITILLERITTVLKEIEKDDDYLSLLIDLIPEIKIGMNGYQVPCYWKKFIDSKLIL